MDRIPPLTREMRRALAEECIKAKENDPDIADGETETDPQKEADSVHQRRVERLLSCPRNKHCLIRTYLGAREIGRPYEIDEREAGVMRNPPMHLNWMRRLGLEYRELAREMSEAFVIMHWGGRGRWGWC